MLGSYGVGFSPLIYFNEPVESYLSDSFGSVSLYVIFSPLSNTCPFPSPEEFARKLKIICADLTSILCPCSLSPGKGGGGLNLGNFFASRKGYSRKGFDRLSTEGSDQEKDEDASESEEEYSAPPPAPAPSS